MEGDSEPLMMAQSGPHQSEKKRAKVYELRDDDWFDRGTGFCFIQLTKVRYFSSSLMTRCALRWSRVTNINRTTGAEKPKSW